MAKAHTEGVRGGTWIRWAQAQGQSLGRSKQGMKADGAHEEVREAQDGGEQQGPPNVQLLHLRRAHLEGQHAARPLPDAAQVNAQLCAGRASLFSG